MNSVMSVTRDEYEWMRDLVRRLRTHNVSAESEVTALRAQQRLALSIMRSAIAAHRANDPIAMGLIVEEMEGVVLGE